MSIGSFLGGRDSLKQIGGSIGTHRTIKGRAAYTLLLFLGLLLIAIGFLMIYQANRTKDWPTASATATHVERQTIINGDGDSELQYLITYDYDVKGSVYQTEHTSKNQVTAGNVITLKYNPEKPSESLASDVGTFIWIFFVAGGLMMAFALFKLITFKKDVIVQPLPAQATNMLANPIPTLNPLPQIPQPQPPVNQPPSNDTRPPGTI